MSTGRTTPWPLLLVVAFAAFAGIATPAYAQTFPSRPLTIVVPYPAGGVTDNLVRLLAEGMKPSLGQSIVVENIGGGGGTIGVDHVARAAPDGYTLVLGNSESMVFAPVTMAISYNALTDFTPVALLPSYPFLLVTTNDVPAKNLEELIAWIKAYAVTAKKRIVAAPEIPTANEAGLPGFYTSVWNALWAPKATPKEAIAKINAAITTAMADEKFQKRMVDLGLDMPDADQRTPEALGALREAEIDKWWPILKAAGLKAE